MMIAASMTADGNTSGHPSPCGPRPAPAPSRPSGCRQPRWRHLLAGLSQCHRGVRRHPAFGLVPEIFQSACLRAGPRIRDPLLPITRKLTAWQAHDGPTAEDMPGAIELGRIPRADTAYDSNRLRDHLAGVGAKAVIKPIPSRSAPPQRDREACRRRKRIERIFSKLKYYRAIATTYRKHDVNFLALVKNGSHTHLVARL